MIQPNELRIGNTLRDKLTGTLLTVDLISIGSIGFAQSGLPKGWQAEPIPLTEEWLVKCGFVNGELVIGDLSFKITLDSDNMLIEMDDVYDAYIRIKKPAYHHQLQNVVHALTGQELKIEI